MKRLFTKENLIYLAVGTVCYLGITNSTDSILSACLMVAAMVVAHVHGFHIGYQQGSEDGEFMARAVDACKDVR